MLSPDSRVTACPPVRQKLHLASCAEFQGRLYDVDATIVLGRYSGG